MSAIGAAGVNLGFYTGSTLAGIFGSLVLYGVSVLQTFIYYVSYPDDSASKKLLVIIVFLLDTVHSILACAGIWNYLVQHFGDLANIMVLHATVMIPILITTFVSLLVQSYFVWRIWCLSTGYFKRTFPAVMMPFVIVQPALGCYYITKALKTPTIVAVSGPLLTKVANVSLAIAAAVDVIIATVMCTLLAKGRTRFNKQTDRILFRWTIISINTGIWTAFFAVLTLVLHALHPSDLLLTAAYFPLCTVYCNTLLANFNVRSYVASSHVPACSRRLERPVTTAFPLSVLNNSIETAKHSNGESCEKIAETRSDIASYA
ncbi:hypothetical protein BS17DRAFT_55854 [Gyrodon lividus]|nr:hypothetical protein BS17DRAFT_55854 [Gyrodon lividus]